MLKDLFSKKPKTKLYYIEIDDEKINKRITELIIHMEQEISQFRKQIDETTWEVKDEVLMHLYEEMTKIKEEAAIIHEDVNRIVGLKLENMQYFVIKDDSYLSDKKQDLERINEVMKSFLDIVQQRPSHEALKRDVFENLTNQLKTIEEANKKILADDISLQTIYKKLNEV